MKKALFLIAFMLVFASKIFAQDYELYANTHFGFEILYPKTLLPQGESDSKDGQTFVSKDKKVVLWAYYDRSANLIDEKTDTNLTFKDYFQRDLHINKKRVVTYKTLSKNFFVISGREGTKIFYRKTIDTSNGWFTFELVYEESEKEIYNKACGKIGASFK